MKANEFVKKFGLVKAIEVVKNRPPVNSSRYRARDNKYSATISTGESVSTIDLKRLVESHELVETLGGFERVKKAIDGKHIGYTHFYLHSNGRYVFLDHYVDFIPDHAQHIGMFNKAIADVESCVEVLSESN